MSCRCASLAGDPPLSHRGIKILRFCGPPVLGPCKGGVLRPVRHAQRIAPIHAKRHILADRGHLGIIRAEPLKSIIILGTPVCKAFQRPEKASKTISCRPVKSGGSAIQASNTPPDHPPGVACPIWNPAGKVERKSNCFESRMNFSASGIPGGAFFMYFCAFWLLPKFNTRCNVNLMFAK